jgi:hypothetical protein
LVIRMVVPLKAESQMAEEKKAEKTVWFFIRTFLIEWPYQNTVLSKISYA